MSGSFQHQDAPAAAAGHLANLLRWLGAGAVAASGVIFLLGGLDSLDIAIRHWSYLALMALVTACGVVSRTAFGDARSARLLLGLAAALVPVQFAQLGGMIHGLATGTPAPLSDPFALEAADPATVLAVAAATVVLTPLAAFAGFAVLVRPCARASTTLFLLANALLLPPWRNSAGGLALVIVLVVLAWATDRYLARLDPRFTTPDGRAVRALILVPASIAAVRFGFHVDTVTGYCALAGSAGAALVHAGRHHIRAAPIREVLYLAGAGLASLAWSVWSGSRLGSGSFATAAMLIPAAAMLLTVGRLSSIGHVYRLLAGLLTVLAALSLLVVPGTGGRLAALALGALLLISGVLRRERVTTLAGGSITAAALAMLAITAWQHLNPAGWIVLAVAGVLLVLGASVVERHGAVLTRIARRGWTNVNRWH